MTNVLVITADDQRWDSLRVMPEVSRRFDHHFPNYRVNTPICGPERAGFLTGQWSRDHDVFTADGIALNGGGSLDVTTDILPTWLSAAGVSTALFGKYLGADTPESAGAWDHFERLSNGGTAQNAYGYGIYDGTSTTNPTEYVDDYFASSISTWLESVTEPWFAWWTPTTPHVHQTAFYNECRPDDVRKLLWYYHDLSDILDTDLSTFPTWLQGGIESYSATSIRNRQIYYRKHLQELIGLDRAIGVVMDKLATESMLDDTIVAYTSDNGIHLMEKGFLTTFLSAKNINYDYALHVPMLMTGPGIPRGVTHVPMCGQDLTALAVAVAGATPTGRPNQVGIDPRDLIANAGGVYDDRTLLHQVLTGASASPYPSSEWSNAVSTSTRKLIRWESQTGTDEFEMYDLDTDPHEHVNVAYEPGRLAERNALEAQLDGLLGD